jgi:alginate O-acetyltransferase complex protein AlgI
MRQEGAVRGMDAMFFNSQAYLLFFAIVFTCYWVMPWHRLRVYLLVAASFYFYYCWSAELACLVASTTVMDYLIGRGLEASTVRWRRRLLLGGSLTMNLGLLCYFKYANFFLDSLREALTAIGAPMSIPYLQVILPFGISFYTFEAISYTVDVYRRKIPAEQSLPNFMLFILFFPHLVAGPIVRARDFLPQAARPKRFDWLRVQYGVQYFLMGLFKKMAIADRMAIYSDPIFTDPGSYKTGAVWLGVLAFAIRIYCDFSGYSDMALGSAHMLGYKLTINFKMPYLSLNVSEFWRRWHISLSSWLRDYLFIPLGGSRGSGWFTSRNLMITMLLGGLWHGANWSYVIWGGLHGALLVIHRAFRNWCAERPKVNDVLETAGAKLARMTLTFFCVMLCWVFFQPSLSAAATMLSHMFTLHGGQNLPLPNQSLWVTVGFMAICHWLVSRGIWKSAAPRLPAPVLGFGYALTLSVALLLAPDTGKTFIYFQF